MVSGAYAGFGFGEGGGKFGAAYTGCQKNINKCRRRKTISINLNFKVDTNHVKVSHPQNSF